MRSLIHCIVVVSIVGCGATHVVPVKNVERATTVWESNEGLIPHLCLEYASPAEKLDTTKASLGVPIGNKSVQLTYESAESLATIYTVTEIMQFGHAALYRLCEAVGNGALDKQKFGELFGSTLANMNGLIRLQLEAKDDAGVSAAVRVQRDIQELDKQRCRHLVAEGTAAFDAQEWQKLLQDRAALVERYEAIREAQPILQGPPADRVEPLREPVANYRATKSQKQKKREEPLPKVIEEFKSICGIDLGDAR